MKAICEYTEEELVKQRAVRDKILEKIKNIPHNEKWDINEITNGYAHYVFKVKPSQRMLNAIGRNPTTDEMIIIVDDGFSHFGASCSESNGVYNGRVNTD